jgi:hypothetical protein
VWISKDGRAISNAWADPASALPTSVLVLVDRLDPDERARLGEAISEQFSIMIEEIDAFASSTDERTEAEFEGKWMPPEVIAHLRARSITELIKELAELDFRWRLDAYGVIEQYVEA